MTGPTDARRNKIIFVIIKTLIASLIPKKVFKKTITL